MFFCWDITIPKNTLEDTPYKKWLNVTKGVITRVDVKFPAGCHGMVNVRLFLENLQLVPLSEDEWITGDDETIPTETGIELSDRPYKLKFVACSPDTDYDHVITVRIEVKEEESAGTLGLSRMVNKIIDALGLS